MFFVSFGLKIQFVFHTAASGSARLQPLLWNAQQGAPVDFTSFATELDRWALQRKSGA
jgi:hypothetical protein